MKRPKNQTNYKPEHVIDAQLYMHCKQELISAGYADEIDWQTSIEPCSDFRTFRDEIVWVILNSGMKEQIARLISNRIKQARKEGLDIATAFKHEGKVEAIKFVWGNAENLFNQYQNITQTVGKLNFLQAIPFIGGITKYHAAKNLGVDCVKPDRHLVRLAKNNNTTPEKLCQHLSDATGDKVSVVDIVLWRSCNLQML